MPYIPFVAIFLVGVAYFQYLLNRPTKSITEKIEELNRREHAANFIAKSEINEELYLFPNEDILPFNFFDIDAKNFEDIKLKRINKLQEKIKICLKSPMIKLAPEISNTTLKETFGSANLDTLIDGEQNYNNYIKYLNNWAEALIETHNYEDAKIILNEALHMESDTSLTFILLITIYSKTNQEDLNNFMVKINNRIEYPMSDLVYKKIISHYEQIAVM